jgi:hypothetical protein
MHEPLPAGIFPARWIMIVCALLVSAQVIGYGLLPRYSADDESTALTPVAEPEGCTIGVACGRATADGRPLLWKTRDNAELPANAITFAEDSRIRYVALINAGETETWMGVNENGFAILNATASDLPAGSGSLGNGGLMQLALATCSSVNDFVRILDSTNDTGRRTQGNFGVIDAQGSAKMFEVGGNVYWMFDAERDVDAPRGYILRTNFSMTGGGTVSRDRYARAHAQTESFLDGDTLDYYRILRYQSRDFSDHSSNQLPVPYTGEWQQGTGLGCISSSASVCRNKTCSAAAIVGIRNTEDSRLSTMWTIIGQPAAGIVVPFWPVGTPPALVRDDKFPPMYEIATRIRDNVFDVPAGADYIDTYKLRDECGRGVWNDIFPAEDLIMQRGEERLAEWRSEGFEPRVILETQQELVDFAFVTLSTASAHLLQRSAFVVANDTPWKNEIGKVLPDGALVQLIWAGPDGMIDPPRADPVHAGVPGGDDIAIGYAHAIGQNVSTSGTFRSQCVSWNGPELGRPAVGDRIYVRVFNSDKLAEATYYNDSQLFAIEGRNPDPFIPHIKDDRTVKPFKHPGTEERLPRHDLIVTNYPNPFNPTTSISYTLDGDARVTLTVFDMLGREVSTVVNELQRSGSHRVSWGGDQFASGVYYYTLLIDSPAKGKTVVTKNMVLIR